MHKSLLNYEEFFQNDVKKEKKTLDTHLHCCGYLIPIVPLFILPIDDIIHDSIDSVCLVKVSF